MFADGDRRGARCLPAAGHHSLPGLRAVRERDETLGGRIPVRRHLHDNIPARNPGGRQGLARAAEFPVDLLAGFARLALDNVPGRTAPAHPAAPVRRRPAIAFSGRRGESPESRDLGVDCGDRRRMLGVQPLPFGGEAVARPQAVPGRRGELHVFRFSGREHLPAVAVGNPDRFIAQRGERRREVLFERKCAPTAVSKRLLTIYVS